MDSIAIIIAILGISVCFLYMSFKFNTEHYLLTVLFILAAMFMLTLIPKQLLDEQNYCEIVLTNYTTNTTHINNTYDQICITNIHTTTYVFYQAYLWILRIFMLYVAGYLTYEVFKYLKKSIYSK